MNLEEMSQEFDILYNQVNSNQSPGIDEYEKSVFLTKSQHELIRAYFDPRTNKVMEGFDGSRKRQYDFSSLIRKAQATECKDNDLRYDPRSYMYHMPEDLFLVLNESVVESVNGTNYIYQVRPISFDEYTILMQKPYQYPTKRQAWRIITNMCDGTGHSRTTGQNNTQVEPENTGAVFEVIGRFRGNYSIVNPTYMIRYVRKPTPIVLVNLDTTYNGLSVDGYVGNEIGIAVDQNGNVVDSTTQGNAVGIPCMLPDNTHHEIVQRAVELASAVYNPQAVGTLVGIGSASSTDIGTLPRKENDR